jgi:hypothetical protein
MSDGGKGSKARPYSVTHDEYSNRWDMIFGRDLNKEEVKEENKKQEETVEVIGRLLVDQ